MAINRSVRKSLTLKTKLKFCIPAACHLFCSAVAVATISVQGQNLFESDYASGNINQFTSGGLQSTFASGLSPGGLAFNNMGDLFESDPGSGNIYEFSPAGARSTFASGLYSPSGLAFSKSGNLFVSDYSGNIFEYTQSGAKSTFASGLDDPSGLAFNSAGALFVSCYYSGFIYEFTPGGAQTTFASGLDGPAGLAFNSGGDLFAAAEGSGISGNGNIYEFTPWWSAKHVCIGFVYSCRFGFWQYGQFVCDGFRQRAYP